MEANHEQKAGWQRWLVRCVILALAVGLITGAAMIYCAASTAIRAEKTLHATIAAIKLTEEFVKQNRRWPKSWEELKQFPFEASGYESWLSWPDVQERVSIDFNADLQTIAMEGPMEFKAIEPIGVHFDSYRFGPLSGLQNTIKDVLADAESIGEDGE